MNTLREYPYEVGRTLYPIDFTLGFLTREDIHVYVGTDPEDQVNYQWMNDGQISLNAPIEPDETLYIQRIVEKSGLINDYEEGARLSENNLDNSFKQALMILEEFSDGFLLNDPFVSNVKLMLDRGLSVSGDIDFLDDLDMNNNKIINLADATADTDATNRRSVIKLIQQLGGRGSGGSGGVIYTAGLLLGNGEDDTIALQELVDDNPNSIIRLHTDIRITSNLTEGSLDNIKLDLNGNSIHVDHAGRLVTSTTANPVENCVIVNGTIYSNEDGDSDYLAGNSCISIQNSYVNNLTLTNWGEDALNLLDNNVVGSVHFDEIRDNCIIFRGHNSIVLSSTCGHVSGDYILYKGTNNHVGYAQADTVGFRKNASNSWPEFGGAGSGIVFGADEDSCSHCSFGVLNIGVCAAYVVTTDPASSYCTGDEVVVDTCYFDNQYPKSSSFSNAYVALIQGYNNEIKSIKARSYPWGLAFGGTRNNNLTVDKFQAKYITYGTILNAEGTDLSDINIGDFEVGQCKNNGAVRLLADRVTMNRFKVHDGLGGGVQKAIDLIGREVKCQRLEYTGHQYPSSPDVWAEDTNYQAWTAFTNNGNDYWVTENHKSAIWIARTEYEVGDYRVSEGLRYRCLVDNTANKNQSAGFAIDIALGYWVLDGTTTDTQLIETDIRLGYVQVETIRDATANGMLVDSAGCRFGHLSVEGFNGYNCIFKYETRVESFYFAGSSSSYDDVVRVQNGATMILTNGKIVESNAFGIEVREGSYLVFANNNSPDATQDPLAGASPAESTVVNLNNVLGTPASTGYDYQSLVISSGATAVVLFTTGTEFNFQSPNYTVDSNDITGATVSTTDITLPEGNYELRLHVQVKKSSAGVLFFDSQFDVSGGDTFTIYCPKVVQQNNVINDYANATIVRNFKLTQESVLKLLIDASSNTEVQPNSGSLSTRGFLLEIIRSV